MSSRDDYRQNAFDCFRLAQTAADSDERAMFIRMAQTWTKLANQVGAISRLAEYAALRRVEL
jgi:hypothetical protein